MRPATALALGLILTTTGAVQADDPRPVPLTRPEMKQFLEDMKIRKPRIPLPELTEEEKTKLGEREAGYENRLRVLYLPDGWGFGGGGGGAGGNRAAAGGNPTPAPGRNSDANMTLDYAFKTELFWIVSRTNNCQYCMGHQESKLLGAGLNEDTIAALDGDWSEFTPAQRSAFAFARKITYQPYLLNDADIVGLREHYQDLQILEMILSTAGNNAINRWKEGAGIPQSKNGGNFPRRDEKTGLAVNPTPDAHPQSYLTPTSEKFRATISRVAPVAIDPKTGKPTRQTISRRPALESRDAVEKQLEIARTRTPRLPLLDETKARAVVSEVWPDGPLPQWVRLVANFPKEGLNRVKSIKSAEEKGVITPLVKAQVSWIIARQDRAWYATGLAQRRLKELGQTDEQIYQLDGDWSSFSPADQARFTLVRKLATSPVVLTDADVDQAVKLTSPEEVTQLICYTTTRASFDRITEAAGLTLSEKD